MGEAAVAQICEKNATAMVELVILDQMSDASVGAAAAAVSARLQKDGCSLYAIVNNAGCGLCHGIPDSEVLATNVYGVKCVTEAFLPLLSSDGRIVGVGSGAGPIYVSSRPEQEQKLLTNPTLTWAELEAYIKETNGANALAEPFASMPGFAYYSFSKAMMMSYMAIVAHEQPKLTVCSVHPGFIGTDMTKGLGATGTPLEGTVPIRWALFKEVPGLGWFFEEDCKRSALHVPRWPPADKPEYDGKLEFGGGLN